MEFACKTGRQMIHPLFFSYHILLYFLCCFIVYIVAQPPTSMKAFARSVLLVCAFQRYILTSSFIFPTMTDVDDSEGRCTLIDLCCCSLLARSTKSPQSCN